MTPEEEQRLEAEQLAADREKIEAAWEIPTIEQISDPVWRLCNLYFIKDADGATVPFRPKPEQMEIIEAIYLRGEKAILIPKARQLGLSTVICIIILDSILFEGGTQAAIVDMTQADATKKLKGKIVFAFERLPKELRERYDVIKSNDHQFSIKIKGVEDDAISEVQAGMSARGDTFQILLISEWGKIAFDDANRSEEILTGALPAAKRGLKIVETTWKGGKGGHLWDITNRAMSTPEEYMTAEDFRLYFFSWLGDPDYMLEGEVRQIPAECMKYLDEVEERQAKESRAPFKLTDGQRLWYYKVAWAKGLFRFQEYPTFLDECFRAPIDGAIYADIIDQIRARGQISNFPYSPEGLVYTFWDEGAPVNTVTWYVQFVGMEIRVIDCDCGLDLGPVERVGRMLAKGYAFGEHFLTHASEQTEKSGKTYKTQLEEAGLRNLRIVPRTDDVWVGINECRQMMPRMRFRSPATDDGVNGLAAYHKKPDKPGRASTEFPVHDWSSHRADGMRTLAEAAMRGMIPTGSSVIMEINRRRFASGVRPRVSAESS